MEARLSTDQAFTVWVAALGDWCAGRGRLAPHPHPGMHLRRDHDGLFRCRWCSIDRAVAHGRAR
jgi:hypothetical protein